MLRTSGAQLDLPTTSHSGLNGYSKESKKGQSLGHRTRLAMQQFSPAQLCISVTLMLICLGLASLLVKHTNEVQEEFHKMKDYAYLNTAPMDHQIEGFEQQKEQIFAQLEPIFANYTHVQAQLEGRHKAVDQLNTDIQTLTDLMVQAGSNDSHGLPVVPLLSHPDKTLADQNELWRKELADMQGQLNQAQKATVTLAQEQKRLAMQIRILRKKYADKNIAITWANKRKARLLGSLATPTPLQGSDDVAASVKRLALDHDLSQPVPTAAEISQDGHHSLDADLMAVNENRAHSREGLQVAADQEPVLGADKEPVLQAGADREPALEAAKEAALQHLTDHQPIVEATRETVGQAAADKEPVLQADKEHLHQTGKEPVLQAYKEPVLDTDKEPVLQADKEPVSRREADAAPALRDKAPDLESTGGADSVQGSAGQGTAGKHQVPGTITSPGAEQTAAARAAAEVDNSVRCRMAEICEGTLACGRGDDLGCITDTATRQQHIKEAMRWSWKGYRAFAWGQDELLPLSHTAHRWFGLGLTLVDSLDTLQIMGLDQELAEAREWVGRNLILDQDTTVNLFETTIRILGGLLSTFYLTAGDRMFLYKAAELGMRMTPGFHSPSGIPWSDVNLQSLRGSPPQWSAASSLSEVTSLTLEFHTLGAAIGHPDLGKLARDVVVKVGKSGDCDEGVCPVWVDPNNGKVHGDKLSLGSRGDSYYEYLLKHWILTGKSDQTLLKQYVHAMKGVRKLLLARTSPAPAGLLYIAERRRHKGPHDPKMDHLVCFLPGLLALGHLHGVNTGGTNEPNDLEVARELMLSCYEMYRRVPAGLSPEIVFFIQHDKGEDYPKQHVMDIGGGDFMVKQQDSHNLLRPETVESLFVLHQVTGDPQYQEWGWHIFRAFEKFARVDSGGYTNLDSVLNVPPSRRDKMESFWTGEALKYLYLLLDPSPNPRFPLDQWVFNTEAHPLPVQGSAAEQAVKAQYLSSAEMMTHRLSGYREHDHLAEWLQEWQGLDAEFVAQQFPVSRLKRALASLTIVDDAT